MSKSGVIVLANRVGAGLFNFARLLRNDLVKRGHEVVVLYIEDYLLQQGRHDIAALRRLYQRDRINAKLQRPSLFAEIMSQVDYSSVTRLQAIIDSLLQPVTVINLVPAWSQLLDRLSEARLRHMRYCFVTVDAKLEGEVSGRFPPARFQYDEICLFDVEDGTLRYRMPVPEMPTRNAGLNVDNYIFCHGGGWDLLQEGHLAALSRSHRVRYFERMGDRDVLVDVSPDTEKRLVVDDGDCNVCSNGIRTWPHISQSKAVFSKPGGMSLFECILFQVPLVLSFPISLDEESNSSFAINSGIGIKLEDFVLSPDRNKLIDLMRDRMMKVKRNSDLLYPRIF